MSPDGHNVYVASAGEYLDTDNHAIAVFDRADSGNLTQKAGSAGCIWETAYHDDRCRQGRALLRPGGIAVSPDGNHVYVTSLAFGAVAVLDRDASGALSQRSGASACISEYGFLDFEPDEPRECRDGHGIDYPLGLVVSPDGKQVYVSGYGVATLDVEPDGSLTESSSRSACTTYVGSYDCLTGRAVAGAFTIDGSSLKLATTPDFETKPSYAVRIRTTDSTGLSFEKAFTIAVTDVNEAPAIAVGAFGGCVDDMTAVGTVPLKLADPDGGALTVTAASSNAALVPLAGITLSGSGAARSVRIAATGSAAGRP